MANVHNIVNKQFPEFVRTDYPAFVDFIEAYYKWMDIQSTDKLEDIVNVGTKTFVIKLQPTYDSQPINLIDFVQEIVVGVTSGARAYVKKTIPANGDASITFYVEYITADARFVDGEEIYVEHDSEDPSANTIRALLLAANATGTLPSQFIDSFKAALDVNGTLNSVVPYNTLYLEKIREVYTAKGSEQALLFLLKTAYSAVDAVIKYPSENILRASDGQWVQETFLTVETVYGDIPTTIDTMFIEIGNNIQRVPVTRFEVVSPTILRLYFKSSLTIPVTEGQYVQIRNAQNIIVYYGSVVRSPATIAVMNGGKNWQLGQVIVFPGTVRDTVTRVTSIDSVGAIKTIEIVEYGYTHMEYQTVTVSPYPNKPLGIAYDILPEILTEQPLAIKYVLTVQENLMSTSDLIVAYNGTYFLQDYVYASESYNGDPVVAVTHVSAPTIQIDQTGLTIEQWFDSRATLVFQYGTTTTLRGRWLDSKGQVSNSEIVLQDSFYYQQFSYVIDTDVNPTQYVNVANVVHPAGLKLFTNLNLTTSIEIVPTALTVYPFILLDNLDVFNISDLITSFAFIKQPSDTAIVEENIAKIVTPANKTDTATAGDAVTLVPQKIVGDLATVGEEITNKPFIKVPSDTATIDELLDRIFTATRTSDDTSTVSEQFLPALGKYLDDQLAVGVTESIQNVVSFSRALTDSTTIQEQITLTKTP